MPSTISAGTTAGTAIAVAGDTTGNLAFQTNGTTTAMTITTAQNVGIGTTTPIADLEVKRTGAVNVKAQVTSAFESALWLVNGGGSELSVINAGGSNIMSLRTNNTERARIEADGVILVGTTSFSSGQSGVLLRGTNSGGSDETLQVRTAGTGNVFNTGYYNNNGRIGSVTTGGSSTSFNTNSDYRLKENIAPMTGALAKVQQLKPCTYKWKVDGSDGQGFIAHELAEVIPDCVSGEKDAVDEQGNPVHQGVDTSFLVATLTAAIQELKAELDATKAEVAALKQGA